MRGLIWGVQDVAAGTLAHARPVARRSLLAGGVNVVGYFDAALGLTESARNMALSLRAAGVPTAAVAVRAASVPRAEPALDTVPPSQAPYRLNLICANGDGLRGIKRRTGRALLPHRHSVGVWWWELPPAPARWSRTSRWLDEIWVCSQHVLSAVTPVSGVPVVKVPQPVPLPVPGEASRRLLGLPDGFLFHFGFDYGSSFARKNPLGVVQAFRRAFAEDSGPQLVVRSLNAWRDRPGARLLHRAAAGRRDIRIVDGYLSIPDRDAMLAHADCYVSLHRAEGFGLPLAESMRLGKPVIATGWSGNREFMSEDNSYLVDYRLTRVGHGAWPYPPDGQWAEPDLDHAAELMRAVFEDRASASARGTRAAADLETGHDPARVGPILAARLEPRLHLPPRVER